MYTCACVRPSPQREDTKRVVASTLRFAFPVACAPGFLAHPPLHPCWFRATGLGLQRSGLHEKAQALFHSWALEVDSCEQMAKLLEGFVACTGDLGVESGFGSLPVAPFETWLPYFNYEALGEDDGNAVLAPQVRLDVSKSMYIPGLLHIFSNTAKDMLDASSHYVDVHPLLHGLTQFLHRRPTRDLFKAACLAVPPHSYLRGLFNSFRYTLVGWRWEYIWRAIEALAELEGPLRAAWNLGSMEDRPEDELGARLPPLAAPACAADDPEEDNGDEALPTVRQILAQASVAVHSTFFWKYLRMLREIGSVVLHLHHWAETCPCHCAHKAASGVKAPSECPLKGLRGPEVCCGDLDEILDAAFDIPLGRIAVDCMELGHADMAKVTGDFARLRTVLTYTVKQKLFRMKTLPRILIGLAHHDEAKARRACTQALRWRLAADARLNLAGPCPRA